MDKTPAVIVLGSYLNALGIVRSLGRLGVRSTVASDRRRVARWSRFAGRWLRMPDPVCGQDDCGKQLVGELQQLDGPALLFPTNEAWLEVIAAHYDALRPMLCDTIADKDSFRQSLNKKTVRQTVESAGIAVPKGLEALPSTLLEEAGRLAFPVIVKGIDKPRFSACLKLPYIHFDDFARLQHWAARHTAELSEYAGGMIVEEVVPGPDENLLSIQGYADKAHELKAWDGYIKLRQTPPGFGCALAARTCTGDEVREPVARVLKALRHVGQFDIEFKWDPRDKTWQFIEFNPRPGMLNLAATASGVNLAAVQFEDSGGRLPAQAARHERDVYWITPARDVFTSLAAHPIRGLGFTSPTTLLKSYGRPRCNAEFQWADPLPGIVSVGSQVLATARMLAQKACGRSLSERNEV